MFYYLIRYDSNLFKNSLPFSESFTFPICFRITVTNIPHVRIFLEITSNLLINLGRTDILTMFMCLFHVHGLSLHLTGSTLKCFKHNFKIVSLKALCL